MFSTVNNPTGNNSEFNRHSEFTERNYQQFPKNIIRENRYLYVFISFLLFSYINYQPDMHQFYILSN